MGEMGEVSPFRANFLCDPYGFGNAHVSGVLRPKQCVQYKNLHAPVNLNRSVGNTLGIGDVTERPNPVTENLDVTVRQCHGRYLYAADINRYSRLEYAGRPFGFGSSWKCAMVVVENVRKPAGEAVQRILWSVHSKWSIAPKCDGADVVEAMRVIGVVVREKHRIHLIDPRGDQLESQLRRRIDEKADPVICLDYGPNPIALVAWIGRAAHIAITPNLRNAKAGSGAEEKELQRVSTLSRFVVPGTSKGTPAVTIMRSPVEASCLRMTVSRAITIISS